MRRFHYIDPNVQLVFGVFLVGLVSLELITFALAVIFVERFAARLTSDLGIYVQYGSMLMLILLFSTLNLLAAAKLSHRFAGPIVQILRVLKKAEAGNYGETIVLRKNDYLHDVSDAVNRLLKSLQRSHKPSRNRHGQPGFAEEPEKNGSMSFSVAKPQEFSHGCTRMKHG